MASDCKLEMYSIFENAGYKIAPINSIIDASSLINALTRRTPKQNVYIAHLNKQPKFCIRYMEQNDGGTAWMKIDLYAKELSNWVQSISNINEAILYLAGDFWQDTIIKNYWINLVKNLSLPQANLTIVDSIKLESFLENR